MLCTRCFIVIFTCTLSHSRIATTQAGLFLAYCALTRVLSVSLNPNTHDVSHISTKLKLYLIHLLPFSGARPPHVSLCLMNSNRDG